MIQEHFNSIRVMEEACQMERSHIMCASVCGTGLKWYSGVMKMLMFEIDIGTGINKPLN
jgi:hypothetical protein